MFAMAIHDEERNSLLLARDRFGEKPLFVADWQGGVAFASEVKQLARYPALAIDVDPMAVRRYLVTGRPYTGFSSWFTGIAQLQPGAWLRIDAGGRTEGRYFDLLADVAAVEPERTPEAWVERFSAAWERSIELRLRSDVPVGTSLSSGVDSAAVLAEAAAIGHERYHAFTLRYDDARDEGPAAAELAASVGFSWHPVWGRGDEFAETWDRMTWHHETPVESGSVFGQWKVFEAAHAEGIRVVLDGQGSDEVLGGYHKFFASHVRSRIRAAGPLAIVDVMRFGRHVGIGPLVAQARRRLRRPPSLLSGGGAGGVSVSSGPPLTDLDQMRHADITTWSLPNLLAFADRNAMAHSIETRLPFLDPDVAVTSLAMPGSVLFRDGWTKWPLRRHLARRGASGPAWRRGKRWFDLPSDAWLDGPLRPAIDGLRADPHPAWAEYVDAAELRATVATLAGAPGAGASDELMRLLALERFFRVWS
jgi:asparagine synthase (glutamine-hydrolysing)